MTTIGDAHIDDAVLAGHVLDLDALTPEQQDHLGTCRRCRETMDAMHTVTAVIADPPQMSQPSGDVWPRIEQQVPGAGSAPNLAAVVDAGSDAADHSDPAARLRSRLRRGLIIGVAAMVGVIAGVLGTITVTDLNNRDHVVERVRLHALPGKSGGGTAQLIKDNGVAMLRVAVEVPADPGAFHELWLINRDGRRMQDLGVLPPSGQASYPLPPVLRTGLRGYTIVDVSIEPFDGNPAHSHNSVVRGQLAG